MKLGLCEGVLASGFAVAMTAGCGGAPDGSSAIPAPVDGVYSVGIESSTPSGLPKCTSALSGTVAYVASPSGLWACAGNSWCAINCSNSSAGDVAYVSSTQTLLACSAGTWSPVPLPKGPQGDAGPAGPKGAQGDAEQLFAPPHQHEDGVQQPDRVQG